MITRISAIISAILIASGILVPNVQEQPKFGTKTYTQTVQSRVADIGLGDVNKDFSVDALDAAMVLTAAASVGAGDVSGLTREQELAADLNKDGGFNAVDAAQILTYAAYKGSGGTADLDAFLSGKHEEEESTTATSTSVTETTTTMTTTKTTTQAPTVNQFRLEDIISDPNVFAVYAQKFKQSLMNGNRMQTIYSSSTFGGKESEVALAMLNYGKISDEVLKDVFKDYTPEEIKNGTLFFYLIANTQDLFNTDVDFEKYTLDKNKGKYLNSIDDAYRNGDIDALLYDTLMNGNIPQEYFYDPAVMSLLCSYDRDNTYVYSSDVDEHCVNDFINDLCETVFGESYTG